MATDNNNVAINDNVATKQFWKSKAFWGAIVAAAGFAFPKYSDRLHQSLNDIAIIVGILMQLWGRWTATAQLSFFNNKKEPSQ